LISNPGSDASPPQLPSVHQIPSATDVHMMLKRVNTMPKEGFLNKT